MLFQHVDTEDAATMTHQKQVEGTQASPSASMCRDMTSQIPIECYPEPLQVAGTSQRKYSRKSLNASLQALILSTSQQLQPE